MKKRIIAAICCISLITISGNSLIYNAKSEVKYKKLEFPEISNKNRIEVALEKIWETEELEKKKLEEEEIRAEEKQKEIEKIKSQNLKREQQKKTQENIKSKVRTRETNNDNVSGTDKEANFNITFYDACYSCTQNSSNKGLTASGKYAQQGITVAAPKDIPFGTKIQIGNNTFEVQDRGSAIVNANGMIHLDVYVNTHEQALKLGRKIVKGYILNQNKQNT